MVCSSRVVSRRMIANDSSGDESRQAAAPSFSYITQLEVCDAAVKKSALLETCADPECEAAREIRVALLVTNIKAITITHNAT